jgi:nitrate/nitrite-specific signal transduction histidine kinase
MIERADLFGAHLQFASRAGGGTTVRLDLPLAVDTPPS